MSEEEVEAPFEEADVVEAQDHPNLPTPYLHPKVQRGVEAGAVTTVLVFLVNQVFPGVEIPAEVSSAITVLISFVAGFLTPSNK